MCPNLPTINPRRSGNLLKLRMEYGKCKRNHVLLLTPRAVGLPDGAGARFASLIGAQAVERKHTDLPADAIQRFR